MDDFNFDRLVKSAKEASRRFFIAEPDPKEIRTKMSLTQDKFASLMNISIHTLRNWEEGNQKDQQEFF